MTFFVLDSNYLVTFVGWVDHKRLPERLNGREIFEKHDFRKKSSEREVWIAPTSLQIRQLESGEDLRLKSTKKAGPFLTLLLTL